MLTRAPEPAGSIDGLVEHADACRVIERLGARVRVRELARVSCAGRELPVLGMTLGSIDPAAPTLVVAGGVHGLERIGSQVVLAWLDGLAARLPWDETLRWQLERVRLAVVPIVNPGGMLARTRANPRGVDLMRNAPVDAAAEATWIVGGQRVSPRLPWYRGVEGAPMETEARALTDFVIDESFGSRACIALDVHSGFGLADRLWFPYARTRAPFPGLAEAHAWSETLDRAFPNHVYRCEPQADHYVTHGDLWDWLHDRRVELGRPGAFLPLTLEMGSWTWIRKNPRQLFSALGPFNPVKSHRRARVLRRHVHLFELLLRCVASPEPWASLTPGDAQGSREDHRRRGLARWYGPVK